MTRRIATILHATDLTAESLAAFRLACRLAVERDAQLIVLYVLPLAAVMYGPPPTSYLTHMLDELRRMRPVNRTPHVHYQVAERNPAAAIVKTAQETGCDLIVIGTHGRAGLLRLLLGSVAERVVREAPCPVVMVKNSSQPNHCETGRAG